MECYWEVFQMFSVQVGKGLYEFTEKVKIGLLIYFVAEIRL